HRPRRAREPGVAAVRQRRSHANHHRPDHPRAPRHGRQRFRLAAALPQGLQRPRAGVPSRVFRRAGRDGMTRACIGVAVIPATGGPGAAFAQEWLDRLDQALTAQSPGGTVRTDLSVLVDFEGYAVDRNPPGLIFADDVANPRLSVFLDTRFGKHFYSL